MRLYRYFAILFSIVFVILSGLCLSGCIKTVETGNEKPVIYLYGYDGDVDVRLNLSDDITLTHTYPKYNNGWRVNASPDGKLKDSNGRTYNYLFWEGDVFSDFGWNMDSGFCVEGRNTATFLEATLRKLGLNDCEADDFITYWLPRMEDNPYNVICFQGKAYTEAVDIIPSEKPDAEIRVYMVWYGSDEFVNIPEQKIKDNSGYKRKGKTIVEWGGTELEKESTVMNFVRNESDYEEIFDGLGNASVQSNGTHVFVDYLGNSYNFTEDEWSKLVELWSWTGIPEYMIQKQTIDTLLDTLSVAD